MVSRQFLAKMSKIISLQLFSVEWSKKTRLVNVFSAPRTQLPPGASIELFKLFSAPLSSSPGSGIVNWGPKWVVEARKRLTKVSKRVLCMKETRRVTKSKPKRPQRINRRNCTKCRGSSFSAPYILQLQISSQVREFWGSLCKGKHSRIITRSRRHECTTFSCTSEISEI